MSAFTPTASYQLIYVYAIPDQAHQGLLKIGETTLSTVKTYDKLTPDCADLNAAADKRIKQQTQTSGIAYHLLYTELAVTVINGLPAPLGANSDKRVHKVLKASGISQKCPNGVASDEWYEVDLPTVKNAIKAVKEGRTSLTAGEMTPPEVVIQFREEQLDAITKTMERFKHNNTMLWNAKMRYGKTLTALELVRRKRFRRVIIVTHRPVVGSGWQEDFKKIFKGDDGDYQFLFKNKDGNVDDSDPAIDASNDSTLKSLDAFNQYFIYFASIQDLRGSKLVGGNFDKNKAVFEMEWDLIINDEAHEGTQTDLGQDVFKQLTKKKTKTLALSGTPFNIIGQYDDDGIYTWDYIMEQNAKVEWEKKHPGEPNPYADLPQMHVYTYDLGKLYGDYEEYDVKGKGFNFREFFRTWTGDRKVDGKDMPAGAKVGDLIHESDVKSFLNLITTDSADNNYPYSNDEYRDMFRHTLWMVPGVKEARALSMLLQTHPIFGQFKIANVAGDGDWEAPYEDALNTVRDAIANNDYTITLSCGKLTTGVTVKEWTAVFILSGSQNTSAAGYLQTIFRAQSPGSIGGKRKEHCYVFDFAPDRSLKVFAEAMKASSGVRQQQDQYEVFKQFINFCPIIAVNGTQMKPYDVSGMMGQIKRIQVEHAIRSGFDDTSIYDGKILMTLKPEDLKEFGDLKGIVGSSAAQPSTGTVDVNTQGFNEEEYKKTKGKLIKKGRELTEEEKKALEAHKKALENKKSAVSILRAISIRLPLLIYGAEVPFDQDIQIEDFVEMVDPESWREFMPQGVTKAIFKRFTKYYDKDVFVTAGREIRRMALAADSLSPTKRVQKIAEIFSYFKNPDKETVLTPWRVVNMHISDMIGGWTFFNEAFEDDTPKEKKRLDEPRFVDRGEVTATVLDAKARILEINSKSGLYPLYVAYSLYKSQIASFDEDFFTPEAQQKMWRKILAENVFVICKTPMALAITRRTLAGYTGAYTNTKYYKDMIETLREKPINFVRTATRPTWWGKSGDTMKFNAIVGNPPYQSQTNGGTDAGNAARQATPVFHYFVNAAKELSPSFISMIIPARWYNGGMGLNEFRATMLTDTKLARLIDYSNSKDLFPSVDIAGGICYFLWDKNNNGGCEITNIVGTDQSSLTRPMNQFGDIFIRSNSAISIVEKVLAKSTSFADEMVSAIDTFGIPSKVKGHAEYNEGDVLLLHSVGANSQGTSYISRDTVAKNTDLIDKYKIKISIMVPQNGEVGISPEKGYRSISTPQILYPGTVDSFSYLNIGFFDTEEEAIHFRDYMTCKFTRYLMRITYSSVHISKSNFRFVPMLDFTRSWTDADLFEYYGLDEQEIELVQKTMRPLNLETDDIGKEFFRGDRSSQSAQ